MKLVYPQGSTFAQKRRIDATYAIRRYLETAMLSDSQDAHSHLDSAISIVQVSLDDAATLLERSTEDLESL